MSVVRRRVCGGGYHAIEFTRVHTKTDENGQPLEESGYVAPVVLADKCVGCGLCQMSCYRVNVSEKRLLVESAIVIRAGEGKEDRLMSGSYVQLREEDARRRQAERQSQPSGEFFVPEGP